MSRATSAARAHGYAAGIVECPLCHRMRMDLGGPHARRFVDGVLVDCVGRVLQPKPKETH